MAAVVGGLGLIALILGVVIDGTSRSESRVRAGPGDIGVELEVVF